MKRWAKTDKHCLYNKSVTITRYNRHVRLIKQETIEMKTMINACKLAAIIYATLVIPVGIAIIIAATNYR